MGSMTFGVGEIYSNDFLIPIAPFLRPERTMTWSLPILIGIITAWSTTCG